MRYNADVDIRPIAGQGISNTARAIQAGQVRFAAAADRVVADAQSLSDPASASQADLAASVVGLEAERLTNAALAGVFHRQVEQDQELMRMIS